MNLCIYHRDRAEFLSALRADKQRAQSHRDPRVKSFYADQFKTETERFEREIAKCDDCKTEAVT